MNALLDNLLNRPRGHKAAILGIAIILLSAAYYSFIYEPRSGEISKLEDSIEIARNEKNIKQQKASDIPRLQKELVELDAKLKLAIAQLPDRKEIPDLLSSISTKARESGLEILLFRPRAENFQDFYAEIPVDIVVRGSFYNAVGFFEQVGKLNRIVNMNNIEFRNPKVTGNQLALDVSTLATTFRFLDDAERKKIAADKAKAAKK